MRNSLVSVAILSISLSASALDLEWNGFISVGGGLLTDDSLSYLNFDDSLSFDNDSIIALQTRSQINSKWSVTTQLVGRGLDDFKSEFEWAFVTYESSNKSIVRFGLLRAPLYSYSDYLEVGYAYNWIRPPRDVYGRIPLTNYNGIDYIFNTQWQGLNLSVQTFFGRTEDTIDGGETVGEVEGFQTNDFGGIILNMSKDWWSFRVSRHTAKVTADVRNTNLVPLYEALSSPALDLIPIPGLGESFHKVARDLLVEDAHVKFWQSSIDIDYNNILLTGEFTKFDMNDSAIPSDTRWYLMTGYRFGLWTMHVTYGESNVERRNFSQGLSGFGIEAVELLVDAVKDFDAILINDTQTLTVGVRYELGPRTALKIEWQQLKDLSYDADTNVYFDSKNELIAFAIDLTF